METVIVESTVLVEQNPLTMTQFYLLQTTILVETTVIVEQKTLTVFSTITVVACTQSFGFQGQDHILACAIFLLESKSVMSETNDEPTETNLKSDMVQYFIRVAR